MILQNLIVALLVLGSTGYAAWTLAPKALRRRIATALLRHPRLASLPALQKLARAPGGCGCDGCDHAPAKGQLTQAVSVVRFQRPMQSRSPR